MWSKGQGRVTLPPCEFIFNFFMSECGSFLITVEGQVKLSFLWWMRACSAFWLGIDVSYTRQIQDTFYFWLGCSMSEVCQLGPHYLSCTFPLSERVGLIETVLSTLQSKYLMTSRPHSWMISGWVSLLVRRFTHWGTSRWTRALVSRLGTFTSGEPFWLRNAFGASTGHSAIMQGTF